MISRDSAPHYKWGDGCDGWHLVQSDALSVIEERMPPGTSERRHLHRRARQFFYVLAGELTMEVEGVEHRLGANEGIEIAPEQVHQAFNRSANDVRFLVTSQPPAHGDRVDA
jgi:mannose-6-phosphate isomerase-like protein (cupin superfamily)